MEPESNSQHPDMPPELKAIAPPNKFDLANWLERSEMFLNDARQYASIATQTVGVAMTRHTNKIDLRQRFPTTIAEDLAAAHVYATLSNTYMEGAKYCLQRYQNEETPAQLIQDEEVSTIPPKTSNTEGQSQDY